MIDEKTLRLGSGGEMVATPWGESDSLRDRRLRPGPGASAEEVTKNQRDRIFGAMVACIAERGYEATRVADLVEVSGVSSRSFYDLFPNKEACFVAAFEAIVAKLIEALGTVDGGLSDPKRRAREIYSTLATMLAAQPAAAKLFLIEAYAAGPDVQQPLRRALLAFEEMTEGQIAAAGGRSPTSAEMARAHVGALQEIGRTRLREGDPEEMAALVPDLTELMLTYQPPPAPLRLATRPPSFGPERLEAHDDAERVLRAFAVVVAEQGYSGATIHEVAKRGSMSPATFYANFRDKEDALLAAIDSAGAQLVTATMTSFHRSPDWSLGVRAAIGSMLNFLASRPAMAHLLAVEVFAGGTRALGRRAAALSPLGAIIAEGYRLEADVPGIALEAIVGGIGALVYGRVRDEGPASLPGLAPICTYLALAPFIGAPRAAEAANSDGRVRVVNPFEREGIGAILAVQPTKWSVLAILALRRAGVSEVARELDVSEEKIQGYIEELAREGNIEPDPRASAGGPTRWRLRSTLRVIEADEWERLSPAERQQTITDILALIDEDVRQAVEGNTFDRRPDMHLTRIGITVDEQGWHELAEIHRAAAIASQKVQVESAKRLKESGEKGITGRSNQMLFELPDD
ncbi:MAG TPA: TetR/AcrR family transcriptional regulator [Solirubrobacterales bacterium]|nr:TetR/AcrR family transcriptional regulator [Solirubrobacterales bacterium]